MSAAAVRDAFKFFDKDGSGQLSKESFRALLQGETGDALSELEFDELMTLIDLNGDGMVSFKEFQTWLESEGAALPTAKVEPGDSLYAIGQRTGVAVADLALWNGIADPSLIYPGEQLRLSPPGAVPSDPYRRWKQKKASAAEGAEGKLCVGYLPYWTADTYRPQWEHLTHLAWFCIDVDGKGEVSDYHGWPSAVEAASGGGGATNSHVAVCADARAHDVNVTCTIVCHSGVDIHSILSDPESKRRCIGNIVSVASTVHTGAGGAVPLPFSFDGVNIDFEGVEFDEDKELMVAFFGDLRQALDVAGAGAGGKRLELSFAGPPSDWRGVWKFDACAAHCDFVLAMCYDYFFISSESAGPIAPLKAPEGGEPYTLGGGTTVNWTCDHYVDAGVPRSKLVAGLPWYGYEWETVSGEPGAKRHADCEGGKAVTCQEAVEKFACHGRQVHAPACSPFYVSQPAGPGSPNHWQGWVEDNESFVAKLRFADSAGLAGVGIWALGYEAVPGEQGEGADTLDMWPCFDKSGIQLQGKAKSSSSRP